MTDIDWRSVGRGGSRAVDRPTLWIAAASGTMVLLLLALTLPLAGPGAWALRIVGAFLAVPVVWLVLRRQRVLARFAELERTGEHPDNVVRTYAPDGTEIEVIVPGAERSLSPRLGVTGLAALTIASIASGGLAFGLAIIVALAQVF